MVHGVGREKVAAFAVAPQILTRGRIINTTSGYKDTKGLDRFIVCAPIKMGGHDYIGVAIVQRDEKGSRFYLHEVGLKEKLQTSSKTASTVTGGGDRADAGVIKTLLSDIFSVNPETVNKIVDENGEPRIFQPSQPSSNFPNISEKESGLTKTTVGKDNSRNGGRIPNYRVPTSKGSGQRGQAFLKEWAKIRPEFEKLGIEIDDQSKKLGSPTQEGKINPNPNDTEISNQSGIELDKDFGNPENLKSSNAPKGNGSLSWLTSDFEARINSAGEAPRITRPEAEAALRDIEVAEGGATGSFQFVNWGELRARQSAGMDAAERFAALFGRRVVVFRNGEKPWINGITNTLHPDKIFINADSGRPYWSVAGHELWHHLQMERPELADQTWNALRDGLRNFDKYEQMRRADGYSESEIPYELLGDALADAMADPGFWSRSKKSCYWRNC